MAQSNQLNAASEIYITSDAWSEEVSNVVIFYSAFPKIRCHLPFYSENQAIAQIFMRES